MRENELLIYKNFGEDGQLLEDMAWLMAHYKYEYYNAEDIKALLYECMHALLEMAGDLGFYGNLWHCYLANLLVNNENSYSRSCEITGAIEGTLNDAVLQDIVIFKEFYDYDFADMIQNLEVKGFAFILNYEAKDGKSKVYNSRIRDRICSLAAKFNESQSPQEMKDNLTQFYKEYGVGKFGLHKAFRVVHEDEGARIVPIRNIAHVALDDLVGYEIPKKKLIDNTEAFVNGKKPLIVCYSEMQELVSLPVSRQ